MTYERIFPTDRHGNPLGPSRDEVVRCRDCKWIHMFATYERTYPEITMYTAYECTCLNRRIYDMEHFCSWGVRADA